MADGNTIDQPQPVLKEQSLQLNTLEHALAFKNTNLFSRTLADVRSDEQRNLPYYPPYFPGTLYSGEEEGVRRTPHDECGELAPAEAVAVQILATEHAALRNAKISDELRKVLQMSPQMIIADVINAFGDFGNVLSIATQVREKILKGQDVDPKMGKRTKDLWKQFEDAIKMDGMILGKLTTQLVVSSVIDNKEIELRSSNKNETAEREVQLRSYSCRHGVTLAEQLYLEVQQKVGQQVRTTVPIYINVEPTSDTRSILAKIQDESPHID